MAYKKTRRYFNTTVKRIAELNDISYSFAEKMYSKARKAMSEKDPNERHALSIIGLTTMFINLNK